MTDANRRLAITAAVDAAAGWFTRRVTTPRAYQVRWGPQSTCTKSDSG